MDRIELPQRERLDPELHAQMLAIAEQALAAGEALEPIAESRSLAPVPFKYGAHFGNWTDGGSSGLERELEATLPVTVLFMDNIKGDALNLQLERLAAKGVKPLLQFRPYFNPNGGIAGAVIEGYANGVVIRMQEDYLRQPLIRQAYDEGRFVVKLFNETNIGGEGFARGRAGFADALRCWKQARSVVKAAHPKTKFISICNTPGNDDVWFTGDVPNAPYWYHGAPAAKANPTQADIQAAIQTCPFREMFELCDFIGIHVYAQDERQVRGDLQTWYSRRHEQALKFLKPYTSAGKKMIISEWDVGYDDPGGQAKRAELCVYALAHIIGPNSDILCVNHWWNSDDNEGAATWEKHQTRKHGEFRPVVRAIADFRAGAMPPEEPPPDEPEEPEEPTPPSGEDIQLPPWVQVHRVEVPVGERYWHLKRAYWQDHDKSGGTHHIYVLSPHNPAQTFGVSNGQQTWNVRLEKPANEPAGNFAMFKGNTYTAWMDGALSDKVAGMHMPQSQHVSYFFEWELRTKEGDVPPTPPTKTLEDTAFEEMTEHQLRITPTFALPKAILKRNEELGDNRKGFDFVTPELRFTYGGTRYALMGAQHPVSEAKMVTFAKDGDWGNVTTAIRLKNPQLEVPYQRQIRDVQVDYARGDCGPATLVSYYRSKGLEVSVDTLSREADAIQNDGKPGFSGLTIKEMQQLAARRGTRLLRVDGMGKFDLLLELAALNPVIVLYNYDAMPDAHRYDKTGKVGGHYALVVGLEGGHVLLHDPYWDTNAGAYRKVKWADFDRAWVRATENGNPARCGLLFR